MRCSRSETVLFPVARALLTFVIVGAVLWSAVPATGASASRLCSMACCAGKPPHEAGSCYHGSCHAHLSVRSKPRSRSIKICGLSTTLPRLHDSIVAFGIEAPAKNSGRGYANTTGKDGNDSARPQATARVFTRPCATDCGAGTSVSSNLGRSRNHAAGGDPVEPALPLLAGIATFISSANQTLAILICHGGPRAPPASHS
jgi:hypothetical protein